MIHSTLRGPEPRRRIAVIQIPRAQRSKLGAIRAQNWIAGPNTTALNSWTRVHDMIPVLMRNSSSVTADEWQALVLQAQQQAALQTPGTLAYTPAPSLPSGATIEAPWTSWQTDDCNPNAGSLVSLGAPSPAVAPPEFDYSKWAVVAGIIGAAASLMYLKQASERRGR